MVRFINVTEFPIKREEGFQVLCGIIAQTMM